MTSHQHHLPYGNWSGRRGDRRAAVSIDEAVLDGVRQVAQANALAIVIANSAQGDVRVIWLVTKDKPQLPQCAPDVLL